MVNCELCNLEKKTKWFYEDKYFIICNCETCKVPMIVSKRHTAELTQEEIIDLIWILSMLTDTIIGTTHGNKLDQNRRKIKDHWHAHIR